MQAEVIFLKANCPIKIFKNIHLVKKKVNIYFKDDGNMYKAKYIKVIIILQ